MLVPQTAAITVTTAMTEATMIFWRICFSFQYRRRAWARGWTAFGGRSAGKRSVTRKDSAVPW
jgi:hypothetical protein